MVQATPALANAVRPGEETGFALLHHVAHAGATSSVAMTLIAHGAWRTLRDAKGDRPLDVARARGHGHLEPVLRPVLLQRVPPSTLTAIERHFHVVIRGIVGELEQEAGLRLPRLEPMLERFGAWWFPVPGMYGGFRYQLIREGPDAALLSESWCRIVDGSEQRYEIDARGSTSIPQERLPNLRIARSVSPSPGEE